MSEEERQAIIHLLDKQARYEYCIKNNISFSDEDYEAYIIRQSMINKDKKIERLEEELDKTRLSELDKEYRINKAIEYINENWGHWCSNHFKYATETINILKGSDKE